MRYFIFALTIGSLLLSAPYSNAQSGAISPSISVNPSIVKETLKPGETKTTQLTLSNLGTDPIPLSSSTLNISKISDAGAPEFTTAPTPRSAETWLKLDKPDFILAAGQKVVLDVTITAPPDTAPGGYSAALIFQAKLPSYYFDLDANARILPALSVSYLVTVASSSPPTIDSLRINSFQAPRVVISAPVPLVTEINNPTNFFIYANGEITVKPAFGNQSRVTELKGSVLMPDANRKYVSAYTGSIWPGIYQAQLSLNQGEKTLVASSKFVVIPWQFILIVLIFSLVSLGIKARRRMKRAWAALSSKDSGSTNRPIIR